MINKNPLTQVEFGIPAFVTEELNDTVINSLSTIKSTSENDVTVFLSRVARNKSFPNDSNEFKFLDVMCRKLSVHHIVRTSYDIQWQLAINRAPLPVKWWPLMLFLLLGKRISKGLDEDAYGIKLKRINAAFIGTDVAEGLGMAQSKLQKLKRLAEQHLYELTG